MQGKVITGVVLRVYQSRAWGNPWVSELWVDAHAIRLYQSRQQPDRFHAVERAEQFAARFGYVVVVRKNGRFPSKIKLG